MPKVHFIKKAMKDNAAVKKGESYYRWSFRYGGDRVSATYPRASQLTQSKMSEAYAAAEAAEDTIKSADNVDDMVHALEEAAEAIRAVGEEYQEAADNFPNGGAIAEQNKEKAEQCNSWADDLESSASGLTDLDPRGYFEAANHEGKDAPDDVTFGMLCLTEREEFLSDLRDGALENVDCPF